MLGNNPHIPTIQSRQASASTSYSTGSNDEDLREPITSRYAIEAVKQVFSALEPVAGAIPVPGLGAAIKLGVYLLGACDDSGASLDRAKGLRDRIQRLTLMLVSVLKEKNIEDIDEKLQDDIQVLHEDFLYVRKKLDKIAAQSSLRLFFCRGLNDGEVKKCETRLNNLLERFKLSRDIEQEVKLDQIAKQILAFYKDHQQSILRIEGKLDTIGLHFKAGTASYRPRARDTPPEPPDIFHGRESLVAELAQKLTSVSADGKYPRVCILGPGGMGKTSTALAVVSHHSVTHYFPEGNRVWVPCAQATSTSFLLDILYTSLGVTQETGNTLNDIISELKASTSPLLLLLDNFETPWNVEGTRPDINHILRTLHRVSRLVLFITMRSFTPPEGIQWDTADLTGVSPESAYQIYSDIHPAGAADSDLSPLLEAIGYMPLAITLMAKLGKVTGLSAVKLMKEYDKIGTRMLKVASDSQHSLDICISLSVDSTPMIQNPEALILLEILAMLPAGTTVENLLEYWGKDLENCLGSLQVLQETSLVQKSKSKLQVHPVVRRYILHTTHFPELTRSSVINATCRFLDSLNIRTGRASKKLREAVSDEEGNLESILLSTTVATPEIVKAMIKLGKYQQATRPRLHVIAHALELSQQLTRFPKIRADAAHEFGHTAMRLGLEEEARERFRVARQLYLSIPDLYQAAECLLHNVRIGTLLKDVSVEERKADIATAQLELKSMSTETCAINCNLYLSCQYVEERNFSEAIRVAHKARDEFVRTKASKAHVAEAAYYIAEGCLRAEDYDAAEKWGTTAISEAEAVGFTLCHINARRIMASLRIAKGDYQKALELLEQCLEHSRSFGSPLYLGLTLTETGRAFAKLGNVDGSRAAFQECLAVCANKGTAKSVMMRCEYFLKKLDNRLYTPSFDEEKALQAEYSSDVNGLL